MCVFTLRSVKLWHARHPQRVPIASFDFADDYVSDVKWFVHSFCFCGHLRVFIGRSPVHPALFAAVDVGGALTIWNICTSIEEPVVRMLVAAPHALVRRVCARAVCVRVTLVYGVRYVLAGAPTASASLWATRAAVRSSTTCQASSLSHRPTRGKRSTRQWRHCCAAASLLPMLANCCRPPCSLDFIKNHQSFHHIAAEVRAQCTRI
jgi:hypothetical protein